MDEDKTIPYGYCQCGCGQKTTIAKRNNAARGHVKGEPTRFLTGHRPDRKRPVEDRFWEKADRAGGPDCCWPWLGHISKIGYGKFYLDGRQRLAHRLAYEYLVGPIPEGLQLDHLCRVRQCVNPAHLEPVTNAENARRGETGQHRRAEAAAQTHCKYGHPLSGDNISTNDQGHRRCRACGRDWYHRNKAR